MSSANVVPSAIGSRSFQGAALLKRAADCVIADSGMTLLRSVAKRLTVPTPAGSRGRGAGLLGLLVRDRLELAGPLRGRPGEAAGDARGRPEDRGDDLADRLQARRHGQGPRERHRLALGDGG